MPQRHGTDKLVDAISVGSNTTLTDAQVRGQVVYVTATATITPPAVSSCGVGSTVTVYSTTAAAVHVDPDDDDRIILDGTALDDGDKITSASGAGDMITLHAESTDGWATLGRSGTWTDGS